MWLARSLPTLWNRGWCRAFAPLFGRAPFLMGMIGFRKECVTEGATLFAAANIQDDISGRLLVQFGEWARADAIQRRSGGIASEESPTKMFKAHLDKISTPMLFLAGAGDRTATPDSVKYAFDRVSSNDKTFRVFGRAYGGQCDYDHVDLVLGKHAPQEVYPVVEEWLAAH